MFKKSIQFLVILLVVLSIVFLSRSGFLGQYRDRISALLTSSQDDRVLVKTLQIKGLRSEVSSTSDGASITPTFGPSGILKVLGTGSVNFNSLSNGSGVSFEKGGTQNTNTAFYLFDSSDTQSVFDYSGGEVSFLVKSKYSRGERIALPPYKYRTVFAVDDAGDQKIGFYIEADYFVFYFKNANITKTLSSAEYERYFSKGKELKVKLVWKDSKCSVYLDDTLYNEGPCDTTGSFSSSSMFSFGAGKPSSYGGGWWSSDDSISDFTVSKYVKRENGGGNDGGSNEKLNKALNIKGVSSEVSSTSDGASVTPTFGPSAVLKVKGRGAVNFSSFGVSFGKGGTQNSDTSYYLFSGNSVVKNIFDYSGGEVTFNIKSKYSRDERIALPPYKYRTVFAVDDASDQKIGFYIEADYFVFYFKNANITKTLSSSEYNKYFGNKDQELKVRLKWKDSVCSIYLNDILYASQNCDTRGELSDSAIMSFGAGKPSSYGGGWWSSDDSISDFTVSKYTEVKIPDPVTDTTPPSISDVVIKNIDTSSATLSWVTDEDSTADVSYGTSTNYDKSAISPNPSKIHSIILQNLSDNTVYNFAIKAKDSSNNQSTSQNFSFSTKAKPPPPPVDQIPSGASNKIIIKEIDGKNQNNRVFSVSRVFKQGDIANFPQAKIAGSLVETQADVKNRWPDGSVKHAILSFIYSLPANSSISVDFVNQSSCNCGNGLSASEMLSSKYNIDAKMTLSPGGSVDIRDVIGSGNIRYWLSGPIVTEVIVEDRTPSRSFDLSFGGYKSFHPMFIATFYPSTSNVKVDFIGEDVWADALQDIKYSVTLRMDNKNVYSKNDFIQAYATRWRKTFWKNKPDDIHIDHNLAYMVETKALPNFDTSIKITNSAIDDAINKPWNSQCGAPSWVETVRLGKNDIGGPSQVCTYMPDTGGRPDLGLIPGWYTRFLYSMSSNNPNAYRLMEPLLANADVGGSVRLSYRETKTGKTFSKNSTESAFGKSLSLDARSGYTLIGGQADATEGDGLVILPNAVINGRTGIEPEINHLPSLSYIPYILTGDYYYLENLFMAASYAIGVGSDFDVYRKRNPNTAGIISRAEYRGVAWGLREIGLAGFIAPNSMPEQEYFTRILNRNIAFYEGLYNFTSGAFYDSSCKDRSFNRLTETSPWCYGNRIDSIWLWYNAVKDVREDNPMKILEPGNGGYAVTAPSFNPSKVTALEAPWGWGYNLNVWGMLSEMGYPFKPILNDRLKIYLYLTIHPDAVPQLVAGYVIPTRNGSGRLIQTPKEFVEAFSTSKLQEIIADNYASSAGDGQSGFVNIARAAMSYLPGVNDGNLKGQDAWNFINNTLSKYRYAQEYDQTWAIVPRYIESQQSSTQSSSSSNSILDTVRSAIGSIVNPVINTVSNINTSSNSDNSTTKSNRIYSSSIKASEVSDGEYVITWKTNIPANSFVTYKYSIGSSKWATETISDSDISTSHSVTLKNLKQNTIYYFKVGSKDANGNVNYSSERIFNTIK